MTTTTLGTSLPLSSIVNYKCVLLPSVLVLTVLFLAYDIYDWETYQSPRVRYSATEIADSRKRFRLPNFELQAVDLKIDFNLRKKTDVIIVLHIQKTGGSYFGRHLVKYLFAKNAKKNLCECPKSTPGSNAMTRCSCKRPGKIAASAVAAANDDVDDVNNVWLVSRFTTGWVCGLHSDWTELKNCIPEAFENKENVNKKKKRYFYITVLRNPVLRYLSEWQHVRRGATWDRSKHECGGRSATSEELPNCYQGDDWTDVGLDDFMDCGWNLASNRMTRMLADLTLVGCYDTSTMSAKERDERMLRSAKTNLRQLAFFGLTEYQQESQYLFEQTFKLNFKKSFALSNDTRAQQQTVTPQQIERIKRLNALDLELYDFARTLFFQRKKLMEIKQRNNGIVPLIE